MLDHETKLKRYLRNELNRSNEVRNKQHDNDETFRMTKRIRTNISIKRNEILNKKKRNKLCYNPKRIKIKVIPSNIYKIRETVIYKRLSRQLTL